MNQLTSFIDASQVYGSSFDLAISLRNLTNDLGRLREGKVHLPLKEMKFAMILIVSYPLRGYAHDSAPFTALSGSKNRLKSHNFGLKRGKFTLL